MAARLTPVLLSGSTGGRGIKVVQTASTGTTIHATGTSATIIDHVTLFCVNSDTTDRKLTIEFGNTTSPDDTIEMTIPAESGLVNVTWQLPLVGTGAAARTITAFAATANVLIIYGSVMRYTP